MTDLFAEAIEEAADVLSGTVPVQTIPDLPPIDEWAEDNFFIVETKRPIVLQPVQRTVLKEFTRRRDDGRFLYATLLYSTIKKSGKTTIGGLYQRWACETWGDYGECYHMGNKLGQAMERAFRLTKISIELGGARYMKDWDISKTRLTHIPTNSFIKALPVNAAGEAGGNQRLTTWTELHGYKYDEDKPDVDGDAAGAHATPRSAFCRIVCRL